MCTRVDVFAAGLLVGGGVRERGRRISGFWRDGCVLMSSTHWEKVMERGGAG